MTDDILRSPELAKTPPIAPPATPDNSKLTSKPEVNSSPPVAQPVGLSAPARAAWGRERDLARATAWVMAPAREPEEVWARAAMAPK